MEYFELSEFECACGECDGQMDTEFLAALDDARALAGVPFVINSGFRCEAYNKARGHSTTSSHQLGLAADIAARDSTTRFAIIDALINVGFSRIGVRKDFIHVDLDRDKDTRVMWMYS